MTSTLDTWQIIFGRHPTSKFNAAGIQIHEDSEWSRGERKSFGVRLASGSEWHRDPNYSKSIENGAKSLVDPERTPKADPNRKCIQEWGGLGTNASQE